MVPRSVGLKIGSKVEAITMLKLAIEKKLYLKVELINISKKGYKEAMEKVKSNNIGYYVTLVGFKKAFSTWMAPVK